MHKTHLSACLHRNHNAAKILSMLPGGRRQPGAEASRYMCKHFCCRWEELLNLLSEITHVFVL